MAPVKLPSTCQAARLSAGVVGTFRFETAFELLDTPNAGVLFGQLGAGQVLEVAYSMTLFATLGDYEQHGRSYARGRFEAAAEAAWQLGGLRPLGFWLAYPGSLPGREQRLADLAIFARLDLAIEEWLLLCAWRPAPAEVSFRAATYLGRAPLIGFRTLRIVRRG